MMDPVGGKGGDQVSWPVREGRQVVGPTGDVSGGLRGSVNQDGSTGQERAGVINLFQTAGILGLNPRGRSLDKRSVYFTGEGLRQHDYPTSREPLGQLLDASAHVGATCSIRESDGSPLSFLRGSNGLTFGRQTIQINETCVEKTG